MVDAVVPAAREVVPDGGAVLEVTWTVEMRFRVTTALHTKKLERVFENGVIDGRMDVECC